MTGMTSSALAALVSYGTLALLWVFVLLTLQAVRRDLAADRPAPASPGTGPGPAAAPTALALLEAPGADGGPAGATRTLVPLDPRLPVTLGRAPSSTVVLDDDYASTHHAQVVHRDGRWWVEDLGSTNGTSLDGRALQAPAPLVVGARVTVGRTVLEAR